MKLHGEVRFHLGRGKNYMKWQVRVKNGARTVEIYYYDPSEYQLEMRGCKLINKVNKAKKVHKAGVKDVAGWVKCEEVMISQCPVDNLERLFYNPIRDVNWRRESDSGEFAWDDSEYATLITNNKQVYILEERI
jgi:hypothetical protein